MIHILHHQTDDIVGWISKALSDKHINTVKNEETYDFVVSVNEPGAEVVSDRSRILIPAEDGDYREFIVDYIYESTTNPSKKVNCVGSFTDLKKAKVITPRVLESQTVSTAVNMVLEGIDDWQLGTVDVFIIRKWTIDKHIGALDALRAIASLFESEMRFRVTTDGYKVTGRYVDFIKRQGVDSGKEIVAGKDLIGIVRKSYSDRIVTALHCLGPEKEDGTRLETIVSNDDAYQNWNRKGKHLVEIYEPESSDQDMTIERLTTLGNTELNKRIAAAIGYEIEAVNLEHILGYEHEKVRLGDPIKVKEEYLKVPMYLGSRVISIERSVFDKSRKLFILGEVIEYRQEDVMRAWQDLKRIFNDKIAKMVICSISTSAGNVFKNGKGSTTLTALTFLSGTEIDLDGTRYTYSWTKKDKDGKVVAGYIKTTKSITVTVAEITEKATFAVEIAWDGRVLSKQELTITAVDDGRSLYTWVKYADDINGTGIADDPTGKKYIGFAYNRDAQNASSNPADYTWNVIEGTQGPPGTSYYTWLKYADDAQGKGMADLPEGKKYIGLALNKTTPVESTNPADYQWSLIKGDKGNQGDKGDQGVPGIPGPPGADGQTTYTWVKYADDVLGNGMSDYPDNKKYIGLAYNKDTSNESINKVDYQWSLFMGPQGIPGTKGADGVTTYTWIKYATTPTTGMSDSPTGKLYMGIAYNKTTATESSNYGDYSWSLIKGDKGDPGTPGLQGIQGPKGDQGIVGAKGTDGQTSYTHIAYATNSTGTTGFSVGDPINKTYIGMYVDFNATDSTDPTKYKWTLIKGADGSQGIPGTKGADGQTPYLHIAYATNATGSTGFSTTDSVGKTYIGQYTDYVAADSSTPSKYKWTLIKGDTGAQGAKGDQGSPGTPGKDGIAHMGTTAPSNPAANTTWFQTDATGKVIAIRKWSGSSWATAKFDQSTLNVEKLSALSTDIGEITAGKLKAVILEGVTGSFSGSVSSNNFIIIPPNGAPYASGIDMQFEDRNSGKTLVFEIDAVSSAATDNIVQMTLPVNTDFIIEASGRNIRLNGIVFLNNSLDVAGNAVANWMKATTGIQTYEVKSTDGYVRLKDNTGHEMVSVSIRDATLKHTFIRNNFTAIKMLNSSANQVQFRNAADTGYVDTVSQQHINISKREYKKNIGIYRGSGLQAILTTPIREYHYSHELDEELPHIGVILDESPVEIIDLRGEGITSYGMAALAWKAIQEEDEKVTVLEETVQTQQDTINDLTAKMAELMNMLSVQQIEINELKMKAQ